MPRLEVETTFRTRTRTERSPLESGTRARRMLVVADLSGRAGRGICEGRDALLERPLARIDIDNFDQVMQAFAPRLALAQGDRATLDLEFKELDDFHPDSLRRRVEVLQEFGTTRARLRDPNTFAAEAERLTGSPPSQTSDQNDPPAEDMSGTLERLLGKPPTTASKRPVVGGVTVDLSRMIQDAVRPHIVADRSPQLDPMLDSLALAEAEALRKILHAAEFQRLEAVWRSIARLVNSVEDEGPAILLLDISEEELRNDLLQAASPDRTALYRLIVERETAGAETPGWSLLTADLTFDVGASDIACLTTLGRIAQEAGAPFLAAAPPSLFGCAAFDRRHVEPGEWSLDEEDAARWQGFRKDAAAAWIGLAAPRVLLRLPYGKKTDPVDGAPFEEVGSDWSHEDYLWGSPAFACAALILAQAGQDLSDLPAHIDGDGMKACAETLIGERAAERMLSMGPMPWMSYRDRPAARLLRLQSVADPATSLPGITL